MTIWVLELIMTHQDNLVQEWPIVLMGQGTRCFSSSLISLFPMLSSWWLNLPDTLYLFFLSWVNCRLFSCGTSKDGESHIVEWNESEGAVKRSYVGLGKRSMGVVQFDTTKNKFLVAGDEFVIKFWDVDNVNLLMTTDADGGLPVLIE